MGSAELANRIEELAANAWPAPIQQQIEGWRLRAGFGASRRANSVMTTGPVPQYDAWREEIEAFYRRWDLPVRYHITAASPEHLDEMLAGMGYGVEGETYVQGASCLNVLVRSDRAASCEVSYLDKLDARWLDAFMLIDAHPPEKRRGYEEIMSRIALPTVFVLAHIDGEPVGIGSAVVERGWAGIFNIATAPTRRKGGIGTQTMRALTAWAHENGAQNLYLQVLKTNEAALRLYEKLGFSPLYSYHYRGVVSSQSSVINKAETVAH